MTKKKNLSEQDIAQMTALELIEYQGAVIQQLSAEIAWPDANGVGRGRPTLTNTQTLLDWFNITIRYNEMIQDIEITVPGQTWGRDTEATAKLVYLESLAETHNLNSDKILKHIIWIANQNSYHPVRDWIKQQVWDGVDRLPEFYDSIVLDGDNPLKETMMRKWASSCVAAVFHESFSCEGTLCLTGEQGVGKTSWVNGLIPQSSRSQWNSYGTALNVQDKDSKMIALRYWITELGELDSTFKKSELGQLKAFLTQKIDMIRAPYGAKFNNHSRRTVFYGTVNDYEFLQDAENRRFWVLAVKRFNPLKFDIGQFWAQIYTQYLFELPLIASELSSGWWLTGGERQLLGQTQEVHRAIDPVEETLADRLHPPGSVGTWLSSTAILQQCHVNHITKRETNQASRWLRKAGYQRQSDTKRWFVDIRDQFSQNYRGQDSQDSNVSKLKFRP